MESPDFVPDARVRRRGGTPALKFRFRHASRSRSRFPTMVVETNSEVDTGYLDCSKD